MMKSIFLAIFMAVFLTGCVVEPVAVRPVVRGVVGVRPYYARPGLGYRWQNHPRHGWGWNHPHNGWHRRWR